MRRKFDVSISAAVRVGVMKALAERIPEAIAVAKDPNATSHQRLAMIEYLKVCREAELSLEHPELSKVLHPYPRKRQRKRR
jgi:hypothetical protein